MGKSSSSAGRRQATSAKPAAASERSSQPGKVPPSQERNSVYSQKSGASSQSDNRGKPRNSQEKSLRETQWQEAEGLRLRDIALARAKAARVAASGEAKLRTSSLPPKQGERQAGKLHVSPRSSRVRQPLSREERERREKDWITRDVLLHAPKDRSKSVEACAAEEKREFELESQASSAPQKRDLSAEEEADEAELAFVKRQVDKSLEERGRREGKVKAPVASSTEPNMQRKTSHAASPRQSARADKDAPLRAAAKAAGLPESVVEEVKQKLGDSIPVDVIEQELPWILKDIAIGRERVRS